jgi:HemY protein
MIKLIWRFGLLIVAAIGFAWLADRPGTLTLRWLGREIEISFLLAVALAFLSVLALMFILGLFRKLWRSPETAREYLRFRKARNGYQALSRGIIAAGAGDAQAAARHAVTAGNNLMDEPLVNVLAAQAAQLKGDRPAVKKIFEAMASDKDTEAMGLRGLFADANQARDIKSAKTYAERALALNPRLNWAASAMLQIQAKQKNWAEALVTVGKQAKAGAITTAEAERKQAVLYTALALAQEDTDSDAALTNALKAHKLQPSLVPAAIVAGRRYVALGKPKKAIAILSETWALAPHPDVAEVLAHAKPSDGPEDRFERVRDLVGSNISDLEQAYALARAASAAKRWDVAKKTLEPFCAAPQTRICALMADIELGLGDTGRSREWLARAIHAPRDPLWVSDGVANLRWTPVSPITGDIIPCEWKVPFEMEPYAPSLAAPAEVTALLPTPTAQKPQAVQSTRAPDDPGPDGFDLTPP